MQRDFTKANMRRTKAEKWLGRQEKRLKYIPIAENAYRDLRDETGKAHGDRLKAWFYYDRDELELSRRHNESSILALIKNEPNMESVNRVSYDFLSGLIDLEEGKVGSAKSRLTEMDSLLADMGGVYKRPCQLRERMAQGVDFAL